MKNLTDKQLAELKLDKDRFRMFLRSLRGASHANLLFAFVSEAHGYVTLSAGQFCTVLRREDAVLADKVSAWTKASAELHAHMDSREEPKKITFKYTLDGVDQLAKK